MHNVEVASRPVQREWQRATGTFFLADASDVQRQCAKLGRFCNGGAELLCGFPTDSPSTDCVALGQDIAAKKAGGSIDYAQTSGAVSHGALVVSQLLQNVASFAMPKLGNAASLTSLPSSTASKTAATKLLQSYYPLYNHSNDPGVLISDSNATYIIQDEHGQVTIDLARRSPIFAIAMETPTITDLEGRCESVEMRWFSVYVQLEGKEGPGCQKPASRADAMAKGQAGDKTWCQVGHFEYLCQRKSALQVFCLDAPPGAPRVPASWPSNGSEACWSKTGWLTQRVRIALNGNWGAEATRVRRLRVLALL
ncbi:uncharacterized protein EMH_0044960 [Eimeria mitis]|uniref:Uncharacterized protein n=1 Tax=Eimeria mitis TaxID=44415 RepID=U6KD37_9EIME|nr:uncharacterized protein EMH_0044960 [Eimeria mitis]CDJ35925.1 hypothetical protein, conserved [Eimeria mitis]